jgi:hypothetical protein
LAEDVIICSFVYGVQYCFSTTIFIFISYHKRSVLHKPQPEPAKVVACPLGLGAHTFFNAIFYAVLR